MRKKYWKITVYINNLIVDEGKTVTLPKNMGENTIDSPTLKVFYTHQNNAFILCEQLESFFI